MASKVWGFFLFFSILTVKEFIVDICTLIGIASGRFERALFNLNVSCTAWTPEL